MAPSRRFNNGGSDRMLYPETLKLATDAHIQFQIKGGPGEAASKGQIALYIPNGIQKSDNIAYSNTDLKAAQPIFEASKNLFYGPGGVTSMSEIMEGLDNAREVVIRNQTRRLRSALGAGGEALVGGDVIDAGSVGGTIDYMRQNTVNPNTKALLERINIRTFSLQFTFIPATEQESEAIEEIIKTFRMNMYPEISETYFLKYPSVFAVTVYPAGKATKDIHITKWKDSYLSNLSVTNNPTSTTYHKLGAPVESTLTLAFTEYTSISREDIEAGF